MNCERRDSINLSHQGFLFLLTSGKTGERTRNDMGVSANFDAERASLAAALPVLPVYRPDLSGNERRYVMDCLETTWISSIGVYIDRFERAVCEATGARHALGVCNGTSALHLALHCLGIGPGDE